MIPNRKARSGRGRKPTIHTKKLGEPKKRNKTQVLEGVDQDEEVYIRRCLEVDDNED